MPLRDLFPALPNDARCWIYAAARPMEEAQQRRLMQALDAFFEQWASHGRPVQGAATILHDRFLLVAGVVEQGTLSGCGIDASVHVVEASARETGVRWLSPLHVFFRGADGAVQEAARPAFRRLVGSGDVTAETPVFDVSLTTLDQVRQGAFEQPAGKSWHARVFRIPQPAA